MFTVVEVWGVMRELLHVAIAILTVICIAQVFFPKDWQDWFKRQRGVFGTINDAYSKKKSVSFASSSSFSLNSQKSDASPKNGLSLELRYKMLQAEMDILKAQLKKLEVNSTAGRPVSSSSEVDTSSSASMVSQMATANKCITKIQHNWRRTFRNRTMMKERCAAVAKIQKLVKPIVANKIRNKHAEVTVTIQKYARAFLARKVYHGKLGPQLLSVCRQGLKPQRAIQLLLKGANANQKDVRSQTILMHCALNNWEEVAEVAVERGAKLYLSDRHGWTALHFACEAGHPMFIEFLRRKGADPHVRNAENMTPGGLARSHGNHEKWKLTVMAIDDFEQHVPLGTAGTKSATSKENTGASNTNSIPTPSRAPNSRNNSADKPSQHEEFLAKRKLAPKISAGEKISGPNSVVGDGAVVAAVAEKQNEVDAVEQEDGDCVPEVTQEEGDHVPTLSV